MAIYSTLGLAGKLAEVMREHHLMTVAFFFLMFLTVATIVGSGLKRRPGRREVWVALGVTAVIIRQSDALPITIGRCYD